MTDKVIECKGLTHYYGKRKIYEDLNFDVPKGRILGLLGKNGTGKTTTINILMGYLKPRAGKCEIFGEDIQRITPATRARIALLLEGHIQYAFMTIESIERYYSAFYPKWNRNAYYELMNKLKVTPHQKIANMSCGQRSQVALGLILAQNADLLVLDDFSLGLDPGYRRLFIEYLHEYAKAETKTIFLTSHIIQDMERLVDDCIIMDYGRILVQQPVDQLMKTFKRYSYRHSGAAPELHSDRIYNPSIIKDSAELYSFEDRAFVEHLLRESGVSYSELKEETMSLEDVFIGLTGKY